MINTSQITFAVICECKYT